MILDNFPHKIGIFPLSNVIFFPRTILPLNIFEKRYIELVRDCMKEKKLFGMVQPKIKTGTKPDVYKVGCLGKIVSFNETDDRRFIISLSGIIRFKIEKELDTKKLYREFLINYKDFMSDLETCKIDKNKLKNVELIKKIKLFFKKKKYLIELNQFEKLNFEQIISTGCMISPFSAEEKQKLIETVKIDEKIKILEEIINFNLYVNEENKRVQ